MTDVFAIFLGLTVTASVMAGIMMILRAVLKKQHAVSRSAFVLLWMLVFVRACIPFGLDINFGDADRSLPNQKIYEAMYIQMYNANSAESLDIPYVFADANLSAGKIPELSSGVAADKASTEMSESVNAEAITMEKIIKICAAVWLTGTFAVMCFLACAYIRESLSVRRKRKQSECLPLSLAVRFEDMKRRIGIRRAELCLCSEGSGAVYGIIRPTIVVGENDLDRLEMIIAHELVHIKRKDNFKKAFALFVAAIHWFNPVIWLAVRFFCRDVEMACDESVLKVIGREEKKSYAGTLLSSAEIRQKIPVLSCFGESPVYERIKHILFENKKRMAAPVICLIAGLFMFLGCFTSPAYALSRHIAASAGSDLEFHFQKFDVSSNENSVTSDYATYSEGAVFVLKDKNSGDYSINVVDNEGKAVLKKEISASEGGYGGSIYCDDSYVYYLVLDGEDYRIRKMSLQDQLISDVVVIRNSSLAPTLFGGGSYLCWYDGNVLRVFDTDKAEIKYSYITNGNQTYGSVQDGWLAYQCFDKNNGNTVIKCVNLDTGNTYSAVSVLGENTYSVYGNGNYLVYKEDYGKGYSVYIYDKLDNTTTALWDIMPEEYSAVLRESLWGIELLGNNVIISGEGSMIYTVDLDNGKTKRLYPVENMDGNSFFSTKNSGKAVSAMLYSMRNADPETTGSLYVARLNP